MDKDIKSKIQDDLWLEQDCYSETEVESFVLKALVSDQPVSIDSAIGRFNTRLHSSKCPALVMTTFSNFRGGHL